MRFPLFLHDRARVVGVGIVVYHHYRRQHHLSSPHLSNYYYYYLSPLRFTSHPSISIPALLPAATTTRRRSSSSTTTTTAADNSSDETNMTKVVRTALDEIGTDGSFKRSESLWRNWIQKGSKFEPERDRYHLYVAYACPWAHRTAIVRKLKGLEDVISMTVVMPVWQRTKPNHPEDSHCGWIFATPEGGTTSLKNSIGLGGPFPSYYPENDPDPNFGAKTVREIYEIVGDIGGKYVVPILFDKKLKTIVSNESADIIQMLNSEFNDFATNSNLDLAPKDMKSSMEEVDQWIYSTFNNGVYACGFAQSQQAYEKAIDGLTNTFDRIEQVLSNHRFIAGDRFTLSDIRLFVTLLRFDEVYTVYFKCNTRSVADSHCLLNYCREIYQMDGVASTVNMDQIKEHYYCSHPILNNWSIIPRGRNFIRLLSEPHDRNNMH